MIGSSTQARLLLRASEALRRQGTEGDRHCVIDKVEEKDGERKALVIWGYKPDGTPCKVWTGTQEQRSSNHRSQDSLKPGQNGTLQGANIRQATFTPQMEAKHAPQPKHAPQVNGHSSSIGTKLRVALHGGADDQQQQGGQETSGASLSDTTEVQTLEGMKNIQKVQLGEKVYSFNTNSNKTEEDTVIGIHVEITEKKMVALSYPGGRVHCTEDHLIWSERRRQYIFANSLYFNEKLRLQETVGDAESLKDLPTLADRKVYHLTIKNNQNFFAREAGSTVALLVHNQAAGGGGGGQQQEKAHYSASWLAKEKEELPKYQQQSGSPTSSKTGSQSSMSGQQQQQQPQQQQKEEERAMQVVMHEEEGHTAVIGKGGDGVRYAAHPKGSKVRAGSDNYFVAEKEKDSFMRAKKKNWVHSLEKLNYVNAAWIIKDSPEDPVPNHDLGSQS